MGFDVIFFYLIVENYIRIKYKLSILYFLVKLFKLLNKNLISYSMFYLKPCYVSFYFVIL